ncbi:MAG: glycosyltransferase [bacterium]
MKIIVFSIRAGMGHIKGGEALCEAINTLDGNSAKSITLLENTFLGWFINFSYLWMARHLPLAWSLLYKQKIFYSHTGYIDYRIKREALRIIDKESPDCLCSTHPFITSAISKIKNRNFKLISVATDFSCHPIGIKPNVDLFIVPHKHTSELLLKMGVEKEKIRVIGIPISLKFSKSGNISKKSLGFDEKPIILEMGGGYGLGHIERFIPVLAKDRELFQLIVIAGKNKGLEKRLEASFKKHGIKGRVFGFVDNVSELMEISDIIIGKPGGVGIMEACAKGLPIVITEVVPGQEEANAKILIDEGIAIMPKYNNIPNVLKDFLNYKEEMKEISEKALKFSKPYASLKIARAIIEGG